ncbi:pilus assembly protein TadG-related protein [Aquidulcibacter paucihalophilus]|uniref:pilus assembly protein TadG-related protein n=1 Tax=Aquidulcibacter paucihalophilus TaxID=1978549 RepID=UPI000A197809|nr:pilus assembly protein TadG-related protein [Aquidulcibacter paucihalophilus]
MFDQLSHKKLRRGNISLVGALALVPLSYAVLCGVEMAGIAKSKANLQAAVDAGALAGAGELSVSTRGDDGIRSTAIALATQAISGMTDTTQPSFTVEIDRQAGTVRVTGRAQFQSMFSGLVTSNAPLETTSTAETLSKTPLCVLQIDQTAAIGAHVKGRAIIRAPGCLVQSNSGISVINLARIEAGVVQAVKTATGTITPAASVGALPIEDPFQTLDLNPPSGCLTSAESIQYSGNETVSLPPGVHCEQISINGNAKMILEPGEHYFKGEMEFNGNATLKGDDVVLIFDTNRAFSFGQNSTVNLTARKTGPLAGFLIATGRTNTKRFSISSSKVRELLGTIYIPGSELYISAAGNVAQDSAWSVIVAKSLTLDNNPVLVINKNYVGSGVPVPQGVGPSASAPRLAR